MIEMRPSDNESPILLLHALRESEGSTALSKQLDFTKVLYRTIFFVKEQTSL